jgi:hypothetical protein
MRLLEEQIDELDADDATGPAQFVLKLPASYARRLATLQPARLAAPHTPSVPWTLDAIDTTRRIVRPAPSRDHAYLAALAAALVLGVLAIGGVGRALASTSDEGPVGISKHAPKALERSVHSSDRRTGVAPKVVTVAIESLAHPRARRRR